ncbi:hypothetical protein KFE25_001594 [Diacronema lutheri]|uniref:Fibronectin type-III domain-containing protein n=1 Tax=Diacronema lutheri TaxID=2081491 RepID=A0A8J5X7F1_DIALT|nr:hypothetical protein KFE25_001594 [Diacronema lutheri]
MDAVVRVHAATRIQIEWSPVQGAVAYRIEYWELTDPSVKLAPRGEAVVGPDATRHAISDCPPGVHVLLRLAPVLADGSDGPTSRPVIVRVPDGDIATFPRPASPGDVVAALLAAPHSVALRRARGHERTVMSAGATGMREAGGWSGGGARSGSAHRTSAPDA